MAPWLWQLIQTMMLWQGGCRPAISQWAHRGPRLSPLLTQVVISGTRSKSYQEDKSIIFSFCPWILGDFLQNPCQDSLLFVRCQCVLWCESSHCLGCGPQVSLLLLEGYLVWTFLFWIVAYFFCPSAMWGFDQELACVATAESHWMNSSLTPARADPATPPLYTLDCCDTTFMARTSKCICILSLPWRSLTAHPRHECIHENSTLVTLIISNYAPPLNTVVSKTKFRTHQLGECSQVKYKCRPHCGSVHGWLWSECVCICMLCAWIVHVTFLVDL